MAVIKQQSPKDVQRRKNRRPNGEWEREVKLQSMKISEPYVYSYIAQSCTFEVWISEKTPSLIGKTTNFFLRIKSSHCILSIYLKIQKYFSEMFQDSCSTQVTGSFSSNWNQAAAELQYGPCNFAEYPILHKPEVPFSVCYRDQTHFLHFPLAPDLSCTTN